MTDKNEFVPFRVDFRAKFVDELENWIDDHGYDRALDMFAAFLQNQIDNGADENEVTAMQAAWEDAAQHFVEWDEYDPDAAQMERDRQEYEAGKAQAELRRAERKIYGDELAEAFHLQDDINAFNRGEE